MLRICALLAWVGMPSQLGALGAMIECAPCNEQAMSACHPPRGCELVRESGCGCCLTCALAEGAACGVYTESCASGLKCVPRSGDKAPLQALLHGRGRCRSLKRRNQIQHTGKLLDSDEKYSVAKREHGSKSHGKRPENPSQRLALKSQGNRHSPKGTVHTIVNPSKPMPVTTPVPDSEYGPCRREMESILQDLKPEFFRSPEDIYIPNCDKRGFYRSKQCKPSKGRKRGHCWCVDKYGHSLPGPPSRKRPVSCAKSASSEEVGY
ncbi:insulin-like growth factor-binding protein 5 [Heterodontus francisci]|uniref:insulin-like growth factor-binding protein 5 n=1 Tax=Heterodontus francisci TaxID=7792 RepID=UPI00355B17C9